MKKMTSFTSTTFVFHLACQQRRKPENALSG